MANNCNIQTIFSVNRSTELLMMRVEHFDPDSNFSLEGFLKSRPYTKYLRNLDTSSEGFVSIQQFNDSIDTLKDFLLQVAIRKKAKAEKNYQIDKNADNIIEEGKKVLGTKEVNNLKKYIDSVCDQFKVSNLDLTEDSKKEVNLNDNEEEGIVDISTEDDFSRVFDGSELFITSFKNTICREFLKHCLIKIGPTVEESKKVRNIRDLNESICEYENKLTKTIHDFLKSNNVEGAENIIASKYRVTKKYSGGADYSYRGEDFNSLMILFNKYLLDRIDNSKKDYLKELNENLVELNGSKKSSKVTLLEAIYAYLYLTHSDNLHKDEFGILKVNRNLSLPIVIIDKEPKFKYSFRKGTNLSGGWADTVSDGLKQLGKFSTRMILSIPNSEGGYLSTRDFMLALLRLRQALDLINPNVSPKASKLKKLFLKFNNGNLAEAFLEILKTILRNDPAGILKALKNAVKGLDQMLDTDFKVLNSIYEYLYGGKNRAGVYQIEMLDNLNGLDTSTYSITDSIISAFSTSSAMNYLHVYYTIDKFLKMEDIKKSKNLSPLFEAKRRANTMASSIINNYSISYVGTGLTNKTINISINNDAGTPTNHFIRIKPGTSLLWQFDYKATGTIEFVTVKEDGTEEAFDIDSLFVQNNNSSAQLIKTDNNFGKVLHFIERMLLIDLTSDSGLLLLDFLLNEFKEKTATLQSSDNNTVSPLNRLIFAAARVLGASDINRKYENHKRESDLKRSFDDWFKIEYDSSDSALRLTLFREMNNKRLFESVSGFGKMMIATSTSETGTIFDDLVTGRAILDGKLNKSTTTNGNKDHIPNTSKGFMDIWKEIQRAELEISTKHTLAASRHLLFLHQPRTISRMTIDTEYTDQYGKNKLIADFSTAELNSHTFLHKFLLALKDGQFISQPVCYSDKKKFIEFVIELKDLDIFSDAKVIGEKNNSLFAKKLLQLNKNVYIGKINSTLGRYYRNMLYNIVKDYNKIFGYGHVLLDEYNDDYFYSNLSTIEGILRRANGELKGLSTDAFIERAQSKGVEVFDEMHFRKVNGKCTVNELIIKEALVNYFNKDSINSFLEDQLKQYVQSMIDSNTLISLDNDALLSAVEIAMGVKSGNNPWISNGKLVYARKVNGKGITEKSYIIELVEELDEKDIERGCRIEYNPLITTQFYLHNLVTENLRLHVIGTESLHKIKALGDITNDVNAEFTEIEKSKIIGDPNGTITIGDLYLYLTRKDYDSKIAEKARRKFNNSTDYLHSLAIVALSKRTVAAPGTIRKYDQGRITGIPNIYNTAVVEDMQADVFDFSGNYGWSRPKTIDAHDGSAWLNPWTSILENYSLDDDAVGDVKKPLWEVDVPQLGAKKLVKYATTTITNWLMLQSEGAYNDGNLTGAKSGMSMEAVHKKMTDDIRFGTEIDLISWLDSDKSITKNSSFIRTILGEGNKLFYMRGGRHYQIISFNRDSDGTYYTTEKQVNKSGEVIDKNAEAFKVYHYVDDERRHIRSLTKRPGMGTIDSLYMLWSAMGGMYSESLEDGDLLYSEASNYVIVNFMNNVCTLNEEGKKYIEENNKKPPLSLTYYDQPLKLALIHYIINKSAIKNGASNVNTMRDLLDKKKKLRYSQSSTLKYGIQQDSDHEADEAEVSETTLVISALDSGGLYHEEVKELYEALGEQTLYALRVELTALKRALGGNFSKLYGVVGKTIINNYNKVRGKAGLIDSILTSIKDTFNLTENHIKDSFKIPFSDPNIYTQLVSTIATVVNKKAIKRKYPGIGQVMVPSYGIYQIYEINGYKMQYKDVLKEAILYNNKSADPILQQLEDNTGEYHRKIVQKYLKDKAPDTNEINYADYSRIPKNDLDSRDEMLKDYDPLSVVRISFNVESGGKTFVKEVIVKLDTILEYYLFKRDMYKFLRLKDKNIRRKYGNDGLGISEEDTLSINKISLVHSVPRDLAPARIYILYEDGGKTIHKNIFDTWVYKRLEEELRKREEETDLLEKLRKGQFIKQLQKSTIPKFLYLLDLGIYLDENNNQHSITNLDYKSAEVIMSNVYASQFGLDASSSMYEIDKDPEYFNKSTYIYLNNVDAEKYDFDFQLLNLNNRNNVYISLSPPSSMKGPNKLYTQKRKPFDESRLSRMSTDFSGHSIVSGNVVSRVFYMSKDNVPLFEVGRDIKTTGITYDEERNKFIDSEGKVVRGRKLRFDENGNIVEYIEFITEHEITPVDYAYKFTKYCINQNNLKMCLLDDEIVRDERGNVIEDSSLNKSISDLLYNIYKKSNSYALMLPAYNILKDNFVLVKNLLPLLAKKEENTPFSKYLTDIHQAIFTKIRPSDEHKYVRINAGAPYTLDDVVAIIKEVLKNSPYTKDNEIWKSAWTIEKKEGNMVKTGWAYKALLAFSEKRTMNDPVELVFKAAGITDAETIKLIRREAGKIREQKKYTKLETWNKKFIKDLSSKRFVSFLLSKFFTASRIPAQNLLSFMKMECVGFNGSDTNQCAVSHWQAFLQGSDYDIDKSYMLGLYFDNNGIFIPWSDSFDFSDIKTLQACCEYLPMVKLEMKPEINYDTKYSDEDFVISEEQYTDYSETEDKILRIKKLGSILKKFYNSGKERIVLVVPEDSTVQHTATELGNDLTIHFNTIYPENERDNILKNFISLGILKISSKTGNLLASYSPIEMKDLRDTTVISDKLKTLESMSASNPAMIPLLQQINMTGKSVVGISANGQKGQYIWRYLALESLLSSNVEDATKMAFSIQLKGVKNRWLKRLGQELEEDKNEGQLSFLSDFDLSDELKEKLIKVAGDRYFKTNIPVDSVISQVISAATDNAKELILGAINAGTKFAKCHLYLMTLGFDAKDIVAFMTSPIVSLVDEITEPNIFLQILPYPKDALNFISTFIKNYIENGEGKGSIRDMDSLLNKKFKEKLEALIKGKSEEELNEMKLDIITFKKVLEAAEEFSSLGRGLGINQGAKTIEKDLLSWENSFKTLIRSAETKLYKDKKVNYADINAIFNLGITSEKNEKISDFEKRIELEFNYRYGEVALGKFDTIRWLTDETYRKITEDYYEKLKVTVNPFYIYNHVPHFKAMFQAAGYVSKVAESMSFKGRLVRGYSKMIREKYPYTPSDFEGSLLPAIDKFMIYDFMTNEISIRLPMKEHYVVIDNNFQSLQWGSREDLEVKTMSDLLSFKKVFEEYIIPGLTEGSITAYFRNSKKQLNLKDNLFLSTLVKTKDAGKPFYKPMLDMLTFSDSAKGLEDYAALKKSYMSLFNYTLTENGMTLGDLFYLYNLLINGNSYGSERFTTLFLDILGNDMHLSRSMRSVAFLYLSYIGELDNPTIELDRIDKVNRFFEKHTMLDILMESAPIKLSTNVGNNIPIIKIILPSGEIIYYRWTPSNASSNYNKMPLMLIRTVNDDENSILDRIRNQIMYGLGNLYNNYVTNTISILEKAYNEGELKNIVPIWNLLMSQGIFSYYTECV